MKLKYTCLCTEFVFLTKSKLCVQQLVGRSRKMTEQKFLGHHVKKSVLIELDRCVS